MYLARLFFNHLTGPYITNKYSLKQAKNFSLRINGHIANTVIVALLLSFFSCDFFSGTTTQDAVARVHNEYLYRKDIEHIVPPNTSASDSTLLVNKFIQKWVLHQVLVNEAMKSMPSANLNFEKQLQDYKNSLIIYAWENEQVINNLDTLISNEELSDFYEQYKESFQLKESIVKAWYIKAPLDAPDASQASKLIRSQDDDSKAQLEEYCLQHAANFILDSESWLIFNDILKEVPVQTNNPENFLRENSMIELTDEYYRYYLRILDFKLKGSTSPLAFERDNIRDMLINQRKLQFLTQKHNQLYQEALSKENIETF